MRAGHRLICTVLSSILLLSLFSGCVSARNAEPQSAASKPIQTAKAAPVIPEAELNSIEKNGKFAIADDSACQGYWIPKAEKTTAKQVAAWLKQAKPYRGKLPKSTPGTFIFAAYVGPSTLLVTARSQISIEPEYYLIGEQSNGSQSCRFCYLPGVLQIKTGGKTLYAQSDALYNWLKKDLWKKTFTQAGIKKTHS